jgi:hypothetical protein
MAIVAKLVPTKIDELADCEIPENVQKQYGERLIKNINAYIEQENLLRFIQNRTKKKPKTTMEGNDRESKPILIDIQDSDDEYLPNHLQTLHEAILQNDTYKVLRTGMFIYENGKLSKKSSTNALNGRNAYPFEHFTTAAFHRNLLSNKSFPVAYYVNEDLYFFLKIGEMKPIHVINTWTAIYHYNPRNSGGIGHHYEKNMINKKACLDDILTWHHSDIRHYIIKQRCLTEILLLAGHFTYRPGKITKAIIDNLAIFCRFPIAYSYLCIRIIYVKWGEWSGLYRTRNRF